MTVKSTAQTQAPGLLKALILLTLFLVYLQLYLVINHLNTTSFISKTITASLFSQFLAEPVVLKPLLFYLSIQLLIHISFALFIWTLTRTIAKRYALTHSVAYTLGIGLWFFYVMLIFIANTLIFNQSIFAIFYVSQLSNFSLYSV